MILFLFLLRISGVASSCICTKEYNPVCCNNQRYSNECEAKCYCKEPIKLCKCPVVRCSGFCPKSDEINQNGCPKYPCGMCIRREMKYEVEQVELPRDDKEDTAKRHRYIDDLFINTFNRPESGDTLQIKVERAPISLKVKNRMRKMKLQKIKFVTTSEIAIEAKNGVYMMQKGHRISFGKKSWRMFDNKTLISEDDHVKHRIPFTFAVVNGKYEIDEGSVVVTFQVDEPTFLPPLIVVCLAVLAITVFYCGRKKSVESQSNSKRNNRVQQELLF